MLRSNLQDKGGGKGGLDKFENMITIFSCFTTKLLWI